MRKQNKFFIAILVIILAMSVVSLYLPLLFPPETSVNSDNQPTAESSSPTQTENQNFSPNSSSTLSPPVASSQNKSLSTSSPSASSSVTTSTEAFDFEKEKQNLEELNQLLNQ